MMKSTLITAAAIALSLGLAAPASAQLAAPEAPMGYTDDGRLNVFGARIDPRTVETDGWRGTLGAGPVVNAPAAGYGIPSY